MTLGGRAFASEQCIRTKVQFYHSEYRRLASIIRVKSKSPVAIPSSIQNRHVSGDLVAQFSTVTTFRSCNILPSLRGNCTTRRSPSRGLIATGKPVTNCAVQSALSERQKSIHEP